MLLKCINNENGNLPLTLGRKYYDYSPINSEDKTHYLILTDICRIKSIDKSYFEIINTEKLER